MPGNDKRYLLIFFKTGGVVRVDDLPENFDFAGMCTSVRSAGYFNNGVFYFPHEVINGMAWVRSENDVRFDSQRSTLQ